MEEAKNRQERLKGIGFAVIATLLWSLNYIIARGVYKSIGPVSLAFFRWGTATIILCPFALKAFKNDWPVIRRHIKRIALTAFFGVTLFNTFIYVAGHFTTAINLAIIGTTAAPVFVLIIAGLMLNIAITRLQIIGTALCFIGILVLISNGSWQALLQFRFSAGDLWVLGASLAFAIYTLMIRQKPAALSNRSFLFALFLAGTILLLPAFIIEQVIAPPIKFSPKMLLIFLYLGAGPSVISFLCWNLAIARLGSPSTAIFGNLITAFSTVEAILILQEKFTVFTAVSLLIIFCGVLIANAAVLFKRLAK